MMSVTANELRSKYLNFFKSKGHAVINSSPLVPENDPTVLFTTAGMHPLVPFLLGQSHPSGRRLTDVQKCIRTGDIDEVGDPVHLTFFEMLGNWSLGDYFKEDAIRYSFEFLTSPQWLGLPLDRLAFTVFAGDENAPFDQEAFDLWKSLGVSEDRIAKLPKEDNWWGPAGQTGPCGPDTEMFYWTGPLPAPAKFEPSNKLWVEIWNNVFMQYNKTAEGKFEPLSQKNVDTGMGVERVTAILQGKASCYDTELFQPLFAVLDSIRGISAPAERTRSERIIVEHIRAATFILGDGVLPGKNGREYVLRRIIRRAICEAHRLGIRTVVSVPIAKKVIEIFRDVYKNLAADEQKILSEFELEEKTFAEAIEKGTAEFMKIISRVPAFVEHKVLSGKNAFMLHDTYGLPIEFTIEMAKEHGFEVDVKGYEEADQKHHDVSKAGADKIFKGGLADHSIETSYLHTATHLLHKALRMTLGEHVHQCGSNITAERLRFDFTHPEKMTPEQLKKVEDIVNDAIRAKLPIICEEMTVDEAKAKGAIGLFESKYGDRVKMYSMGDFSKEICGGPHASNTGDLVGFHIQKEESSSRGVRRIRAVIDYKKEN